MNIIADTHMHTTASTHAYSSLQEMVHAAAEKGLYAVAITDHGSNLPGAPGKWYFHNLRVVPHILEGVLVLRGEETNVIDFDGNIDLEDQDHLDWVVASIHEPCMPPKKPTVEETSNLWLQVAKNPRVNVIGHSGTAEYPYDFEAVIPEFARNGKLVEFNEGTFLSRRKSIVNCKKIMEACKKHAVPVIVNSDSHFSTQVGCFSNTLKLMEEIGFPEELVVNARLDRFKAYLKQYSQVFNDPLLNID